jgi:hypothetical protein
MNNQARHQSNVAAGKKSRMAKMATFEVMLTINLRLDMGALPSPHRRGHKMRLIKVRGTYGLTAAGRTTLRPSRNYLTASSAMG